MLIAATSTTKGTVQGIRKARHNNNGFVGFFLSSLNFWPQLLRVVR